MTMLVLLAVLWTAGSQIEIVRGVGPPQDQPRDPRVQPRTGTGVISGRVTAADTGAPLRRAVVNLSGAVQPRSAYTDNEGRYQFDRLPSGTYNLFVNAGTHRAGYQSLAYGASPASGGIMTRSRPIELADGQKLEHVDVALPRTGVIAGRVLDAQGDPAARVQVTAWIVRPGAEPMQTGFAQTDDLGQYRLFGLVPGDYLVMATASTGGGPMQVEGEPTGFAPTYAPGTPARTDATRLRVTRGGQVSADIVLVETRVFKISGTVLNSRGEATQGTSVMLMRGDGSGSGGFGGPVLPTGAFTINNVPPGQYELVAAFSPPRQPGTVMSGADPDREMATMPIEVGMSDIEGVLLQTRRGVTVTGEIVLDEPLPQGRRANVFVQPGERRGMMMGPPPRVEVKDTTFTLQNVFGPMILRGSVPAPGWALKAVLLRGKDITDTPTIFTAGDSGHLQILFTGTAPSIEGTVTDDAGRPVDEAAVVLFGQDASTWNPRSSYVRVLRTVKDGRFTSQGLRDGRYYAVAVPSEIVASMSQATPELFESLSKVATPVLLNPGEKRMLDLTVVRMQQE